MVGVCHGPGLPYLCCRYAVARYYIEMLLKCDRKYDARTEADKLRTALELQQKAVELLQKDNATKDQAVEDLQKENAAKELAAEDLQKESTAREQALQKSLLEISPGETLTGWLQKLGSGGGVFGRTNWKQRWFVVKDGWMSYHSSEVDPNTPLPLRLKAALGGDHGPLELANCVVITDSEDDTKFRVQSVGRILQLDKFAGNPHTMAGKLHSRNDWIAALLTHPGCKLV